MLTLLDTMTTECPAYDVINIAFNKLCVAIISITNNKDTLGYDYNA